MIEASSGSRDRDVNGAGTGGINIRSRPHPISVRVPAFDFSVGLRVLVDIHGYPL